jgi:hypothetical protein
MLTAIFLSFENKEIEKMFLDYDNKWISKLYVGSILFDLLSVAFVIEIDSGYLWDYLKLSLFLFGDITHIVLARLHRKHARILNYIPIVSVLYLAGL